MLGTILDAGVQSEPVIYSFLCLWNLEAEHGREGNWDGSREDRPDRSGYESDLPL